MIARLLNRVRFDDWRGTQDGRATFWSRTLLEWRGWRVALHRMVGPDDPGCFHTHPASALRIILAGGYVEEREDGQGWAWLPGSIGIVRPELSHRISALFDDVSCSLWIRAPKRAAIQLRGSGWKREVRDDA